MACSNVGDVNVSWVGTVLANLPETKLDVVKNIMAPVELQTTLPVYTSHKITHSCLEMTRLK